MRQLWQRIKSIVDDRVIRPLRESHSPIEELARGTSVGILWAMTPLVGVQMPLATVSWFVFRALGKPFNLPIAIAWVWVSNPVTMPLLYYSFYLAGILIYMIVGINPTVLSFDAVKQVINEANTMPVLEGVWHWTDFMLESMGWPMMIGCLVFCFPLAFIGYPITIRMVNDYRRRTAAGMGLTLEEWEARYVFKTVPVGTPANSSVPLEAVKEAPKQAAPETGKKRRSSGTNKSGNGRKKKATKPAANKKSRQSGKKAKPANQTGDNNSGRPAKKSATKSPRAAYKARPATA